MAERHHNYGALSKLTREQLEPLWRRSDIPVWKIAEALGVSPQAVQLRAKAMGLPGRRNRRYKIDADEFRRLWMAGVRCEDIARVAGYSCTSVVRQRRVKMGLPPRARVKGAGSRSGTGLSGWGGTITISQFREQELGRLMAASA